MNIARVSSTDKDGCMDRRIGPRRESVCAFSTVQRTLCGTVRIFSPFLKCRRALRPRPRGGKSASSTLSRPAAPDASSQRSMDPNFGAEP